MYFFVRLIEIPFGEKDQRGECTLLQGDTVEFQIATDRRDKLQRATNIALMEETFEYSGEIRETVCGCKKTGIKTFQNLKFI